MQSKKPHSSYTSKAGRTAFTPLPDREFFRRQAAQEAVKRLALLEPGAVPTVDRLLLDADALHPKAICTAFRQEGVQLADHEKKLLGIRKNAFMTREALSELSELGIRDPIRAHELTVLRASFSMFRHRNALSAANLICEHPLTPVEVQYDVFHSDSCEVCNELHRKPVGPDWGLFPRKGCTCLTAPYGLHIYVDWIGGCVAQELDIEIAPKSSILKKIKDAFQLTDRSP